MANISGLFQMLNSNISAHPLAQRQNTQVEGQPQRPMDNMNPLLAMGARGLGGAVGANNTGRLDNSQQAQAKRQAQHRQVLAKQASDLGMVDLAKSIMTGDVPNETAMKAIMARKKADADANAATNAAQAAHKETLRTEAREDEIALRDRDWENEDAARDRSQELADKEAERIARLKELQQEMSFEESVKQLEKEEAEKKAEVVDVKAMQSAANYADAILYDLDKFLEEMDEVPTGTGNISYATGKADPSSRAGTAMATLESIKAKMTKGAMDEFRAASSTGSTGFGALSEKELAVLENFYSTVNFRMDEDKIKKEVAELKLNLKKAQSNYTSKYGAEYGDFERDARWEPEAEAAQVSPSTTSFDDLWSK